MFGLMTGCGGGDQTSASQTPALRTPAPQTGPSGTPGFGENGVVVQTPAPEEPGVFGGRLERQANPELVFVVFDEWNKLLFYGTTSDRGFSVAGFMYAGGPWWTSADPTLYNGRDWGTGEAVYLQSAHDAGIPSLSGTIRFRSGETTPFSGGPMPGSTYDYNAAADLSSVAGRWILLDARQRNIDIEIQADGSFSGRDGCEFKGRIAPDPSRKNLMRVSLDRPCSALWGLSYYEGFVLAMPLRAGATQLLFYAESNNGVDWTAMVAAGMR
jgi:hypothetical protein